MTRVNAPQPNPGASSPLLVLRQLQKRFGAKQVLRDVSLEIPEGGVVTIVGRSGTGKSVLLRCIVGLLEPDGGDVLFRGEQVSDPRSREPLLRSSSYVFQHNALFDSSTVLENMLIPLRTRTDLNERDRETKALGMLNRMELGDAAARYPAQLSGGMQKRLAVARALVTDPEIVFFDEPTAGLDPVRRNAVFEMIVRLQRERRFTAILVTHDVREALLVSSKIIWLDEGRVSFSGTPSQFESQPGSQFRVFGDNLEALRQALQDSGRPVLSDLP
jgi:phospholipid/cholesterol/gamma-HCH transport system ATP-binding protein